MDYLRNCLEQQLADDLSQQVNLLDGFRTTVMRGGIIGYYVLWNSQMLGYFMVFDGLISIDIYAGFHTGRLYFSFPLADPDCFEQFEAALLGLKERYER